MFLIEIGEHALDPRAVTGSAGQHLGGKSTDVWLPTLGTLFADEAMFRDHQSQRRQLKDLPPLRLREIVQSVV